MNNCKKDTVLFNQLAAQIYFIFTIKNHVKTHLVSVGVKRQYGKRGSRSDPNAASLLETKLEHGESLRDTANRAGSRALKINYYSKKSEIN